MLGPESQVSVLLWPSGLAKTPGIMPVHSWIPQGASPLLISQTHTQCVDTLKFIVEYPCLLVFVPFLALHVKFLFARDVGVPYGKA